MKKYSIEFNPFCDIPIYVCRRWRSAGSYVKEPDASQYGFPKYPCVVMNRKNWHRSNRDAILAHEIGHSLQEPNTGSDDPEYRYNREKDAWLKAVAILHKFGSTRDNFLWALCRYNDPISDCPYQVDSSNRKKIILKENKNVS
jgi:hypothetical protein